MPLKDALNAAIRDVPLPLSMQRLPVDDRGFPVPWFVAWNDGKPDFRLIGPGKLKTAVNLRRCWVCGGPLRRLNVSVIGPMCVVNKVTSEPPSHPECARYAARACPFLANPRMRRNEKGMPEESNQAGTPLLRNPGVAALWFSLYPSKPFKSNGGYLFDLGRVDRVEWYAHGRDATVAEITASIDSGLPFLAEVAAAESQEAVDALGGMVAAARKLLPPAPVA